MVDGLNDTKDLLSKRQKSLCLSVPYTHLFLPIGVKQELLLF